MKTPVGTTWASYIVSDAIIVSSAVWLLTKIPHADQSKFALLLIAIELGSRFVFGQLCYRWLLSPLRRPLRDDAAAAIKSYKHREYAIHMAMALVAFYGAGLIFLSLRHAEIMPFLKSNFYTAVPGAVVYGMAAWRIPREFNVRDYELVGFVTAWTIALVLAGGVVFTQGGGAVDIVIAAVVMSCLGKPFWVRLGPSQALADRLQEHGNRFLREGERFYSGHTLWSENRQFHLERRRDGRLVIAGRRPGNARIVTLTRGRATSWRLRIPRRGDYVVLQQGTFVRCHRNGYTLGPAHDQSVYPRHQTRPPGNARHLAVSDHGKLIAVGDGGVTVWQLPDDGPASGNADPDRGDGHFAEQKATRRRRQAAAMLISFLALDFPLSVWAEKTGRIPLIGQDVRQQFTFAVIEITLAYGIWLGYRYAWVILLVLTLPELILSAEQIGVEHAFGWPAALMSIQTALLLSPAVWRHMGARRLSSRRSERP